ncbi:uncharacterized protein [Branchiostoma lanceolatum]|uniref:uncharacterized protein n=1 Tax=Branchiostoma lanceolatum TaxID=7740 RepID=UPI0034554A37
MLGGAHVLLEETSRQNIQIKALRTYHMLSQTGDIREVIDAEAVHAEEEFVAQIPPNVWRNHVKDRLTEVQQSIEQETGAEVQVRRLTRNRGPARGQLYAYGTMDSIRRVQLCMERLIQQYNYRRPYRRGGRPFKF